MAEFFIILCGDTIAYNNYNLDLYGGLDLSSNKVI